MSFTVVPLHNLDLGGDAHIPFGTKFVLKQVPQWLKDDKTFVGDLSRHDRQSTLDARHALVAEYEASAIGQPDPEWTGPRPRGIQDLLFQSATLANFALWVIQPSMVCFTVGFHALTTLDGRSTLDPPVILRSERDGPLYCHPKDQANPVELRHLIKAAELFESLSAVPRKNVMWAALRAFWAALNSYTADYRYPLFWQGLESLFTSETKTWKVTERLCARISYFLSDNPKDQQALHDKVDSCYATRSKIIHGRWDEGPEIDDRMADTEAIVRTVVRTIAETPGMLAAFLSPKRDEWLEAWVQSKSFMPQVLSGL